MTLEERLAALGVETRDFVPSDEHCKNLYDKFYAEAKRICKLMGGKLDGPFMVSLLIVAVAKRDIIIDRMETRIVNLTVEREYLLDRMWREYPCAICEHAKREGGCAVDLCGFDFAGVPEDWSADNA